MVGKANLLHRRYCFCLLGGAGGEEIGVEGDEDSVDEEEVSTWKVNTLRDHQKQPKKGQGRKPRMFCVTWWQSSRTKVMSNTVSSNHIVPGKATFAFHLEQDRLIFAERSSVSGGVLGRENAVFGGNSDLQFWKPGRLG